MKLFFILVALSLQGCGFRFAIIKRNVCSHPEGSRYSWVTFNPLHWHYGIHSKCHRCGQKFCEHWMREKWLNKIEVK